MPTYDYKCLECGRTFEVFQRITEEPLTQCRFCNGRVKRLIGAGAGIIFKGSGFYCTDYRSESYKKAEKQEKSAASSSGSDTSKKKTETTPSGTKSKD